MEEEILILELIKGAYDSKLRQELIHQSHETGFEGLVKIAKAPDATNTLQAGLALDEVEDWN